MSPVSGLLDPEACATLGAAFAKWAAPGMCNPDEQQPCVDGEPPEAASQRDLRSQPQRNHDALKAMGRAALASGKLGQHNGLPATIIVSTTLKELESVAGQAVTASGSLLPISDVIRMASHAFHYLVIFKDHRREPLYLGRTKRSPREANASSCTHATAAVPSPAARCPATAAKRTTPSEVGLKVAKPTSTKKSSLAHPTTGSSKRAAGLPEYAPTAGSNGSRRHSWTTVKLA